MDNKGLFLKTLLFQKKTIDLFLLMNYSYTLRHPCYLDKAHANGAHLGELVDGFEAVVDGLSEQLGELLVVEDL